MPLLAFLSGLLGWSTLRVFITTTLLFLVPYLIRGVFVMLGVGAVTYVGVNIALDSIVNRLLTDYDNLPPQLFDILTLLGVKNAITILISGMTSALSVKALAGFTRVRMQKPWKSPSGFDGGFNA